MVDQYVKPYLEASVWLGWIKGETIGGVNRGAIGEHILQLAEQGVYKIYTSTLTLAEVHKMRAGPVLAEEQGNNLLAYFEHDFIELIDVDRAIAEEAHRFCRQYGIFPNDAIHLAAALRERCDVLLAWDNRFMSVNHGDIRIEVPQLFGQSTMRPL